MSDADDDRAGVSPRLPWPRLLPWQVELARTALAGRADWPQALLLHGPPGTGKHGFALHLAQGLLCATPRSDGLACGACADCHYVAVGQHPDLFRVELVEWDDDDDKWVAVNQISVDRIRALITFSGLSAHRQRAKVAVIAPADRMNASAANALLKTLEEPPPSTHLILVSAHPGRLPATILSRCRRMAAPRPTPAEALAWLEAEGVNEPARRLAEAGGAPLAAAELAADDLRDERGAWARALRDPATLSAFALAARIDEVPRDARRRRLASGLDCLHGWIVDLARVQAGGPALRHPDQGPALSALAGRVAPVRLLRYHRLVVREQRRLTHPLQPRLVAESMLLRYREMFV